MTTYFITGGLGFLGQYIVQAIHEHDPRGELRVLVRTKRSTLLDLDSLDRIHWVHGDLLQPETWEKDLQGVDVVIHNAAMVSFRKSEADEIYQSNVTATRNMARTAANSGCKDFIFISSISAVGMRPGMVADENMYPDLETKRRTDTYGYSKMVSENDLQEYTDRMRVLILNPSVVLGPGSDRVNLAARAVRLLPVLPMLSYVNTFVDVRDVAHAVVLALTKGRNGERYIVTAWNIGMVDFTRKVLQVMGKRALVVPVSGPAVVLMDAFLWLLDLLKLNPGIRRLSQMNVDKACSFMKIRHEMGWLPAYTLEQSIADSFREKRK